MKIPKWLLHAGIVLNTIMTLGFFMADMNSMALLSFLSACSFWVGLVAKDKLENNE